jgi:LysM repeat protein
MDIREMITRPVGPLPMWGWIVLAFVGLYLWKKHQASSASSGSSGILSSFLGTPAPSVPVGATTVATGTDSDSNGTDSTNDTWGSDAIGYLEGQGYTQSQAQAAIGTYLAGGTLDPTMATLVDSASQGVGQPPQLILPTSSIPQLPTPSAGSGVTSSTGGGAGTVTTSQSTPTYVSKNQAAYGAAGAVPKAGGPKDSSGHQAYFSYTVKKGDTLASIAKKFGSGTSQLDSWNKLKGNPKVGSTIWV